MAVPSLVKALDISHKGRKLLVGSLTMPLVIGFALILMSLGILIYMLPMVMGPVVERNADSIDKFPSVLRFYWYASVWLRANQTFVAIIAAIPVTLVLLKNTPLVKPYIDAALLKFNRHNG